MRKLLRSPLGRILFLLMIIPFMAWFLVKPVRVLQPAWLSLPCTEEPVCVDDNAQLAQARALYEDALNSLSPPLGPLNSRPHFVFCSSQQCADQFGLGARSAVTIADWGTVVGPKAWKDYYVRHELIHHLQAQQWGVLRRMWLPDWVVEGMAYALSGDPRHPLAEPWEAHRARFQVWFASIPPDQMWSLAVDQ